LVVPCELPPSDGTAAPLEAELLDGEVGEPVEDEVARADAPAV
jgi:hypothetical protein